MTVMTISGRAESPALTDARERFERGMRELASRGKRTPCQTDPHRWDAHDEESGEPPTLAKSRIKGAAWECGGCPMFDRCDTLRQRVLEEHARNQHRGYPVMIGVMAGRVVGRTKVDRDMDAELAAVSPRNDPTCTTCRPPAA